MRATTLAGLLITCTLAVGCSNPPSQEEIAERCYDAVQKLDKAPHAKEPRPAECEGLNRKTYLKIIASKTLHDDGLTDNDSNPNWNKLLED